MKYALLLVTYPDFNKGSPCRCVYWYGKFEDIVALAESVDPDIAARESGISSRYIAHAGWDYQELEA